VKILTHQLTSRGLETVKESKVSLQTFNSNLISKESAYHTTTTAKSLR
jgi:hypothetical protein